jgi:hypothetical protein
MATRSRRTLTLVGPNRLVVGAATAGLVALASAGTALLVLTGTSSVAPFAEWAPPLPSSSPVTRAPGVVVLPSDQTPGARAGERDVRPPKPRSTPAAVYVAPQALAFTDDLPRAAAPRPAHPALRRDPAPPGAAVPDRPGRHLAKGHAKHPKPAKTHGKRVGWSHSNHYGNR